MLQQDLNKSPVETLKEEEGWEEEGEIREDITVEVISELSMILLGGEWLYKWEARPSAGAWRHELRRGDQRNANRFRCLE